MKSKQSHDSCGAALENALPLVCCLAIGVILIIIVHGSSQQHQRDVNDLRKEISALNAGQIAVGKDVGEIRDILRRQPIQGQAAAAPQRDIVLTLDSAQFKGNPNAKVTLVEFTDYECGFCARHLKETYPELEKDYISTGKLKYVFRNFPLESIHKDSFKAHEAAACAGEQGKFWEMHDRLFASQPALTPADILGYAKALGLDTQRFEACLNSGKHAEEIRKDIAEGEKAGVTGTPSFFLGLTTPNGQTLKVAKTIIGAKTYASFKQEIDALLAAPPSS